MEFCLNLLSTSLLSGRHKRGHRREIVEAQISKGISALFVLQSLVPEKLIGATAKEKAVTAYLTRSHNFLLLAPPLLRKAQEGSRSPNMPASHTPPAYTYSRAPT